MKIVKEKIAAVLLAAAAVLCFSSCDDGSTSLNAIDLLLPQGTVSSLSDEEKADKQVMLMFRCEPNADSGTGQAKTEYKVYYSGRVTDEKTGAQKNITGAELENLKKYADEIINKKVETKFDGNDGSTDTTVAAYTKEGSPYQLSAIGKCRIDSFDEMYKIVTDKFKG